jgi:hypothetical protein
LAPFLFQVFEACQSSSQNSASSAQSQPSLATLSGSTALPAADVTFGVQVAWMVLRLIPGKVWLAIGEGFAEMMPWIFIANIDL